MYLGKQTSFSLAERRRKLRTTRAASRLFGQTMLHCPQPIQLHKSGACRASPNRPNCTILIRDVGLGFLNRAGHTDPHFPHCSQTKTVLAAAPSRMSVSLKSVMSTYRSIKVPPFFVYLNGLGPSAASRSLNFRIWLKRRPESSIVIPVR